MLQRDYLQRLIEQLSDAIGAALGLAREGRHDEAKRALDDLYTSQLGLPRRMLDGLDASSVGALVGHEKRPLLEQILAAEVEIHRARGDVASADACARRLAALRAP